MKMQKQALKTQAGSTIVFDTTSRKYLVAEENSLKCLAEDGTLE